MSDAEAEIDFLKGSIENLLKNYPLEILDKINEDKINHAINSIYEKIEIDFNKLTVAEGGVATLIITSILFINLSSQKIESKTFNNHKKVLVDLLNEIWVE